MQVTTTHSSRTEGTVSASVQNNPENQAYQKETFYANPYKYNYETVVV